MSNIITTPSYNPWPELPYESFKSTSHLLHMCTQAMGKLKLSTPFEPHWANVALWLTCQGLTTGVIPYGLASFSVDLDIIDHKITCKTSWGQQESVELKSTSVAKLTQSLFDTLHKLGVDVRVNPKPQEIPNPIVFDQDTAEREYNANLASAWWRALESSYIVLKRYHARFKGITPPIGLMWGTFDLRDARYRNVPVQTTKENEGYLRRNAMDAVQVEAGWWSGNDAYPRAAYYSFTFPQPPGIEQAKLKPSRAHWNKSLGEFILDYDDLRQAKFPEGDLLSFFEMAYEAGAEAASWETNLIGPGVPI